MKSRHNDCFDSDFLNKLELGDEDAWNWLMTHYSYDLRQDIKKIMARKGVSPSELNDIEQLTWKIAYREIHIKKVFADKSEPEKVLHFLVAIAKNLVFEGRRATLSYLEHNYSLDEWLEAGGEYRVSGETEDSLPPEAIIIRDQEAAEHQRLIALIDTALGDLKIRPHHREIFRYFLELGKLVDIPHDDLLFMAKKHNMTTSGVRKVVDRTTVKVRGWMKQNGYTLGGES